MTDRKIILDWSKPMPVKRWPTAPVPPSMPVDQPEDDKGTPAPS